MQVKLETARGLRAWGFEEMDSVTLRSIVRPWKHTQTPSMRYSAVDKQLHFLYFAFSSSHPLPSSCFYFSISLRHCRDTIFWGGKSANEKEKNI